MHASDADASAKYLPAQPPGIMDRSESDPSGRQLIQRVKGHQSMWMLRRVEPRGPGQGYIYLLVERHDRQEEMGKTDISLRLEDQRWTDAKTRIIARKATHNLQLGILNAQARMQMLCCAMSSRHTRCQACDR